MFKRNRLDRDKKIRRRISIISKDEDGINPSIDAQDALNEICRYLLGDDWYVSMPLSQGQVNAEIIYEIENKYRRR